MRPILITIERDCAECGGSHYLGYAMRCKYCNRRYTEESLGASPDNVMPCGCSIGCLEVRDLECCECDVNGRQTVKVTLEELKELMK